MQYVNIVSKAYRGLSIITLKHCLNEGYQKHTVFTFLNYSNIDLNPFTLVVSWKEALVSWRVVCERPADKLVVKGALDLAGDFVLDVVHDGVQVARVAVVCPLVGAV